MSAEEIYKDAFYQAYERLSKEDLFDWVMEDRIAYHRSKVDAIDIKKLAYKTYPPKKDIGELNQVTNRSNLIEHWNIIKSKLKE